MQQQTPSITALQRITLFPYFGSSIFVHLFKSLHRLKFLFSQPFVDSEASHFPSLPLSGKQALEMSLKIQAAAFFGALATTVSAHGHVGGVIAGGTYYQGYDRSFQYQASPPSVVGWSCPQCLGNGFVDPTMFSDNSKIACHKDATAGQAVTKVAAGGTVELQWTTCTWLLLSSPLLS